MELMYLIFPLSLLLQCALVPMVDTPGVMAYMQQISLFQASMLLLSGVAAFAVNYTGFLVLNFCSALTHVILGQGKSAATMLGAVVLFSEVIPPQQLLGAALAMGCIAVYTKLNLEENKSQIPLNEHQDAIVLKPEPGQ